MRTGRGSSKPEGSAGARRTALGSTAWLVGGLFAAGCGGGDAPAKTAESEGGADGSYGERRSGLSVQSEVGAIDEAKAQAAMERAS